MACFEIENKVSMRVSNKLLARWNINKDTGAITIFLPNLWAESKLLIDTWRGYECEKLVRGEEWNACREGYIDSFNENLIFTYLTERICIERAHEKIRLKRNKCKPCVIYPIVEKIMQYLYNGYHDFN